MFLPTSPTPPSGITRNRPFGPSVSAAPRPSAAASRPPLRRRPPVAAPAAPAAAALPIRWLRRRSLLRRRLPGAPATAALLPVAPRGLLPAVARRRAGVLAATLSAPGAAVLAVAPTGFRPRRLPFLALTGRVRRPGRGGVLVRRLRRLGPRPSPAPAPGADARGRLRRRLVAAGGVGVVGQTEPP